MIPIGSDGKNAVTDDLPYAVKASFVQGYGTFVTGEPVEHALNITALDGNVALVRNQATFYHGTNVQLTANPDVGYGFTTWSGDLSGNTNPETILMDGEKSVTASFSSLPQYTIMATAGGRGSITPNGSVSVYENDSQSFTITPNTGYHVDYVDVDLVDMGAITMYNFSNVTAAHTIDAYFAIDQFSVTTNDIGAGSTSPANPTVDYGNAQALVFTPTAGYHVDSVLVDGVLTDSLNSYTFLNVTAAHSVQTYYSLDQFTITTTDHGSGSTSPSSPVVNYNGNQTLNFSPTLDIISTAYWWMGSIRGSFLRSPSIVSSRHIRYMSIIV